MSDPFLETSKGVPLQLLCGWEIRCLSHKLLQSEHSRISSRSGLGLKHFSVSALAGSSSSVSSDLPKGSFLTANKVSVQTSSTRLVVQGHLSQWKEFFSWMGQDVSCPAAPWLLHETPPHWQRWHSSQTSSKAEHV